MNTFLNATRSTLNSLLLLGFSVALMLASGPVMARMTFCQGGVCSGEMNGVARTPSPEDVGKMKRKNARTALGNVDCRHASDPDVCETLMRSLLAQFPY